MNNKQLETLKALVKKQRQELDEKLKTNGLKKSWIEKRI